MEIFLIKKVYLYLVIEKRLLNKGYMNSARLFNKGLNREHSKQANKGENL